MLCKQLFPQIRQIAGLAALSLIVGLSGCGTTSQTKAASPSSASSETSSAGSETSSAGSVGDRPLVIATSTDVCDVTRQIATDTIDLKCLIAPGADPHEYVPNPEDSKAIEQAKLILYGGYNFEPQIIKMIQATSNPAPKVAVHEVAVPTPQKFEDDGQTVTDPHVFQSAKEGAKIAEVIGKNLTQLEPNHASLYAANTEKVTNELTQIDAWIKSEIATIPAAQRKLVTTHDAFGYYSKAYGIPVVGALQGISTEEKATPAGVTTLVKEIEATNVPTIFAEAKINPKLIDAVAKEANVKVADQELFADGLGEKGSEADTYQKLFIANTKAIVEGLGGTYTPFQPKT